MAPAPGGRRVMVTIPEDAPPGTVLSIPVKDCDPVQIRVPQGLGPGSKVKLTRQASDSEWEVEVELVVPLQQPVDDAAQLSQEELAALWESQQNENQQNPELQQLAPPEANQLDASTRGAARFFRPAAQFEGVVPNCVFKLGELGLGYYLDEEQQRYRSDTSEELLQLQEQQLRLQQQRREEELARQRLVEQDSRVKPLPGAQSSTASPSPRKAKVAPESSATVFEPQAPYIGDGSEVAYTVRLDTSAGIIDIIVRPDWAPHGVRRFMEMVAAGELDDLYFYRAIEGCIAQFGLPVRRKWDPIPDDNQCGVPFLHGAVCFAALGENSRKSTLFICTGDMSHCLGQKPWETVIGAIAETSLNALERIDTSYGDIMEFGGNGPDTGRIAAEGNSYLKAHFPRLTHIRKAWPLDWEPENPQDDLSAPTSPRRTAELPKDPVALAAAAAREAQDEALRAARLAAIATTPEQADAAAEAARNAAQFAQQAQAAAARAHAQVEAARSRVSQQQTQPQSQPAVVGSSSGSRPTTPCPQRPTRSSSATPCRGQNPGLMQVPTAAYTTYTSVLPQASSANVQTTSQLNSYTPQPAQTSSSQSYTPMPRRTSVSPAPQGGRMHNSYTPGAAGNSGMVALGLQASQQGVQERMDTSSVLLNTSAQLEASPTRTPLAQTFPVSVSALPGRSDLLLGTASSTRGAASSSSVCRQPSLQRSPMNVSQPLLPPQTSWTAPQSQWPSQPMQPAVSSQMLPTPPHTPAQQQQISWVQQPFPPIATGQSSHHSSIRFAPGGSVQSMPGPPTATHPPNFVLQPPPPFAFNPMGKFPLLGR
mmetsp:Transcript_108500/g.171217  ORF Transcript_108500/g.171217 Transcript_108500/m.171217 type:complete len:821 (-) Transcript_108500:101-2563(-)